MDDTQLVETYLDQELNQLRKFAVIRYQNGVTSNLSELIEIQKLIIASDLGKCIEKVVKAGFTVRQTSTED